MSIFLKYMLRNIREKKFRSLLIIVSLTLSVTVLILNMTLKDNILQKYEEYLLKTTGTTDVLLKKDIPFNKNLLDDLSNNYSSVPFFVYKYEKNTIYGMNIEDLYKNKMIKSNVKKNIAYNEVIISKKYAKKKRIEINDIIEIANTNLKVVDIVDNYGVFAQEEEDEPIYLVSIREANEIMYENSDKTFLDENIEYIYGSYLDVLDDNIENAKKELKKIDGDFNILNIKTDFKDALNQINGLIIVLLVISTLVAFYIIKSILKLVLEERIAVVGTFRSIGASRRKTNLLLYLENTIFALISSALGIFMASLLKNPVSSVFISTGNVEITSTSPIKPLYIILATLFAVSIQFIVTYFELRKQKSKNIKNMIFDTQETRYKIKWLNIMIGILFIISSIVIYIYNNNYNFVLGLLPVVLLTVGFVLFLPLLVSFASRILTKVFKNTSTLLLSLKNISVNKVVMENIILIFIIISLSMMLGNITKSISNLYNHFDKAAHFRINIDGVEGDEEDYDYIDAIEGVKEKAFYYQQYGNFIINGEEKALIFIGYDKENDTAFRLYEVVSFNENEAKNLKDNEILIDEAFAIKNKIKIGDTIKIGGAQYFDGEVTFKVKGFVDSTYTSTNRAGSLITKNQYNTLFKEKMILIDSDVDDEVMVKRLKDNIKESDLYIKAYKDIISDDKARTENIVNIVYVIMGFGILLSMVGMINNSLIAFMQRKREFAVLNSICMSKKQLYKMVLNENIISYIIALFNGCLLNIVLTKYMSKTLEGMMMFVKIIYDVKANFILLVIIFILTILEALVPIYKIKKLNIVKEIKYE